jgi:TPR repeat protein
MVHHLNRVAAIVAVLLVTVMASPVSTGFDEGQAAHNRGYYATALREWRPMANQGDPVAQTFLGVMYANGQGVPQNSATAVKWYRRAAVQGEAVAQFNLGMMYFFGQGVPEDYAEAVRWYRKAAEQGIARAQFNLGVMYASGQGVPQDYAQAHMWWNLAGAQGYKDALKERLIIAKLMTPAQIAEAQRLAREWMGKHRKK